MLCHTSLDTGLVELVVLVFFKKKKEEERRKTNSKRRSNFVKAHHKSVVDKQIKYKSKHQILSPGVGLLGEVEEVQEDKTS